MKNCLKLLFLISFPLLTLAAGFSFPVQAQDEGPHANIRLVPERTRVEPGDVIFIAIEQIIDKGWHTYWVNPGDSGEALRIEWDLPPGFEIDAIQWPVPEKIKIGELTSYGYEERAVLLQPLFVPTDLPAGPLTLAANIDLLVCEEICIPESSRHELVLNGIGEKDNTDYISEAYSALPLDLPWPSFHAEHDGDFILRIEALAPAITETFSSSPGFALIPVEWGIIDNAADTRYDFDGTFLNFRQKRGDRSLQALDRIGGLLTYVDAAGAHRAFRFEALPESVRAAARTSPDKTTGTTNDTRQTGILQAVLFALLGGLILNLMPCVFPVLSLKALKLCKLTGRGLGEARIDSLFYTLGILASFALFAFVILGLRAAGEQVGWGFQLQNAGFVLFLTWLLFAIGLNLSGFYEFGTSVTGFGGKFVKGHSHATSFLTGVLAAIVATPCVAPFMGVALGFALTQPTPVVLAVFLTLGFGLALPYILLAVFPALRGALPAPGPWMETFRQFLAFPMYAAAIWLAWVYTQQGGPMQLLVVLSGALVLAFVIWLFRKAPKNGLGAVLLPALGMLLLLGLAGLIACPKFSAGPPVQATAAATEQAGIGWLPYSEARFAEIEAGDDPVFVNMTAAWCITCKVNERIALETASTATAFREAGIQAVKGDWTNYNAEITAYLERFDRNGVPLYVYYGPRDPATGRRPDPEVLPQLLAPGTITKIIEGKERK